MPVYVYAVLDADGTLRDHFEARQRMSDAPLTDHPVTGEPLTRVPQMPGLMLRSAGPNNTEKLIGKGFARYEKAGDGEYVKTGGPADAPDTIKR